MFNNYIAQGEDSDMEDFEIRKSDNLLVAGHFDEDICSLNVYGKFFFAYCSTKSIQKYLLFV